MHHLVNLLIRIMVRVSLLLNLHLTAILGLTFSSFAIILIHVVDSISLIRCVVESVKRLQNSIFLHVNPTFDEIWECFGALVVHVCASWDCKDVVEFLEGSLLGLRDPEENHD